MAENGKVTTLLPAHFKRSNNKINLSFLTTSVGQSPGNYGAIRQIIILLAINKKRGYIIWFSIFSNHGKR